MLLSVVWMMRQVFEKTIRANSQTGCQIGAAAECGTGGGCLEEVGSVPCVGCLMESRGAQHTMNRHRDAETYCRHAATTTGIYV